MDWHYAVNQQQYGPVSEDEIRRLAQQGTIQPNTLVWRQGMANWTPYSQVFPAAPMTSQPAAYSAQPAAPLQPMSRMEAASGQIRQTPGTGGATPNSELRAAARDALSGQWGSLIGFVLVFWIIQFGINLVSNIIPIIGFFVPLIVTGPFMLGLMTNILNVSRGEDSDFDNLFSGFRNFGRALGAYMIMFLIIMAIFLVIGVIVFGLAFTLGLASGLSGGELDENSIDSFALLLSGIAGIIIFIVALYVNLKFAMVFLVLADHPDMGITEVISEGVGLMKGNMMKLLTLWLSFLGWAILCIFTFFIGFLFLAPYVLVAQAKFYDDIKPAPAR